MLTDGIKLRNFEKKKKEFYRLKKFKSDSERKKSTNFIT